MKDDEIKSLVKKAERAKEKAQKLIDDEGYDGAHADEINELLEEADSYYKDASYVPVKRAVNYVLVQEPYRGDDTGFMNCSCPNCIWQWMTEIQQTSICIMSLITVPRSVIHHY